MATPKPRAVPLRLSLRNSSFQNHSTASPTSNMSGASDIEVGDTVNVPGGMDGSVKFVGQVRGREGVFVGVELSRKWASRGKNDGDADGVRYFSTSTPGSGIFLPIGRAVKAASPASSPESVPPTPATPSLDNFNLNLGNSNNYNSPTPAKPKFSQSVGPGARRAPSPALRPKSRPSLPRPESPLRRAQNTSTPAGRPSFGALNRGHLAGPRFAASPTPNKSNGPITRDKDVDNSIPDRKYSARASQDAAGDDLAHLRTIIQEKNEKIAMLTNEFDAHRADFRSTIDTLELASSETERVYEKRIEDLLEERRSLLAQSEDVGSVALQLKQLEEVVQELEEGLEDARRGEAEARGEVEFLRGEVERVRAELRKEREQNSQAASIMSAETLQAEETPSTDQDKWCALCEGDGHDSISCPFDKT